MLFALLLAVAPVQAPADAVVQRTLGFSTQDRNGLHIVTIAAGPRATQAAVRTLVGEPKLEANIVDYDPVRFRTLWNELGALELAPYRVGDPKADLGLSRHYVIVVGSDTRLGVEERESFRVPKCGADRAIVSYVKRLTEGLLPPGSPAPGDDCAESTRD